VLPGKGLLGNQAAAVWQVKQPNAPVEGCAAMGGWGDTEAPPAKNGKGGCDVDEEQDEGFSSVFYIMLVLGIIGVIGFLFVGAGASLWAL
jgi:hypothetical protein